MIEFNLDFIKTRRKELGISTATMAQLLGFKNISVYWKYENGFYKWKAEMIPTLAEILHCLPQNFFSPINKFKSES